MIHEEITGKILEACFEVSSELGIGYLESVYEKSLLIALRQKGLKAENQIPLQVKFRGQNVGEYFVDILVEEKVLIELKVASGLSKENFAQTINYLKATDLDVGLLVNFGTPKIEYRRFINKFNNNQIILKETLK
ncbi:MAG: GxxExxY protein [Acidobacteriota bacterium]|nr:GxxExxY protein [Acidobacteriota bacterium]